jgi:hypothetical protein
MTRQKMLAKRSKACQTPLPRPTRPKPPRRCKADRHRWYVSSRIPMGIAQVDGWHEVLLTRQCRTCAVFELWSGEQRVQDRVFQQMTLAAVPQGGGT